MHPDILLALVRAHQRDLLNEAAQAARVRQARAASAARQQRPPQATGQAALAHCLPSHRPDAIAVGRRAA
jgi:hypothetical protein